MGNTNSNNKNDVNHVSKMLNHIDLIATKFILTQSFKDLQNLERKEFCDDLFILTSSVLNKRFKQSDIGYFANRIKDGNKVKEFKKQTVYYTTSITDIEDYDVGDDDIKLEMCKSISIFYVKIAHLYSAIVMTLNPIFSYINDAGVKQSVPLNLRHTVPKHYRAKLQVEAFDFCSSRTNSLNKQDIKGSNTVEFSNNICAKDNTHLINEAGIFELSQLYYDVYDHTSGLYTEMTPETQQEYIRDVHQFYIAISGSTEVPKHIVSFSDIKLKNFNTTNLCATNEGLFRKKFIVDKRSSLLEKLGKHINDSRKTSELFREKLIDILDEVFLFSNQQKTVIITPRLNGELLDKLIKEARKIISQMYITCEKDYYTTMQIYESIVEQQVSKTIHKKMGYLDRTLQKTLSEK